MRSPAARRGLCMAMALATAACGEGTADDSGKLALESRCARCHAIGESDTSAHADALPFRDIVKR